jgi:hypothetical protein
MLKETTIGNTVVEEIKMLNAWCMPGGKLLFTLVFYQQKDEAGLAGYRA